MVGSTINEAFWTNPFQRVIIIVINNAERLLFVITSLIWMTSRPGGRDHCFGDILVCFSNLQYYIIVVVRNATNVCNAGYQDGHQILNAPAKRFMLMLDHTYRSRGALLINIIIANKTMEVRLPFDFTRNIDFHYRSHSDVDKRFNGVSSFLISCHYQSTTAVRSWRHWPLSVRWHLNGNVPVS